MLPSLHMNESIHQQRRPQRRSAPTMSPIMAAAPTRRPLSHRKSVPVTAAEGKTTTNAIAVTMAKKITNGNWADALHRSVEEEANQELCAALRSSSTQFMRRRSSSRSCSFPVAEEDEASRNEKKTKTKTTKSKEKTKKTTKRKGNDTNFAGTMKPLPQQEFAPLLDLPITKISASQRSLDSSTTEGLRSRGIGKPLEKKQKDKRKESNKRLSTDKKIRQQERGDADAEQPANSSIGSTLTRTFSSSTQLRRSSLSDIKSVFQKISPSLQILPTAPIRKTSSSTTLSSLSSSCPHLSYSDINDAAAAMLDPQSPSEKRIDNCKTNNEAVQAMQRYGHASAPLATNDASDLTLTPPSITKASNSRTPSRRRQQQLLRRQRSDGDGGPPETLSRQRRSRKSSTETAATSGGVTASTIDEHLQKLTKAATSSASDTVADSIMDVSRKSARSFMDLSKMSDRSRASASNNHRLRRRSSLMATSSPKRKTPTDRLHNSFPSEMVREESHSRRRSSRSRSRSKNRPRRSMGLGSSSSSPPDLGSRGAQNATEEVTDLSSKKGKGKGKVGKAHSDISQEQSASWVLAQSPGSEPQESNSLAGLGLGGDFNDGSHNSHGDFLKRPSSGYRRSISSAFGLLMGRRPEVISEEEEFLLEKVAGRARKGAFKNDATSPIKSDRTNYRDHREFSAEEEIALSNFCVSSFPNLNYRHSNEEQETDNTQMRSSFGGARVESHWMSPFEDNFIVAVNGANEATTVSRSKISCGGVCMERGVSTADYFRKQAITRSEAKYTANRSRILSSSKSESVPESPFTRNQCNSYIDSLCAAGYHKQSCADNYSCDGTSSEASSNIEDADDQYWGLSASLSNADELTFEVEDSCDQLDEQNADLTDKEDFSDMPLLDDDVDMPALDDMNSCDISGGCSRSDRTYSSAEEATIESVTGLVASSAARGLCEEGDLSLPGATDATSCSTKGGPREFAEGSGSLLRSRTVSESEVFKKGKQKRREPAKSRSDGSVYPMNATDPGHESSDRWSTKQLLSVGAFPTPSADPIQTCQDFDRTRSMHKEQVAAVEFFKEDASCSLSSDIISIEESFCDNSSMYFTRTDRNTWSQMRTTDPALKPESSGHPRVEGLQLRQRTSTGGRAALFMPHFSDQSLNPASSESSVEELQLRRSSYAAFERWKDTGALGCDLPTRLPRRHSDFQGSSPQLSTTAKGLMKRAGSNVKSGSLHSDYLPVSLRSAVTLEGAARVGSPVKKQASTTTTDAKLEADRNQRGISSSQLRQARSRHQNNAQPPHSDSAGSGLSDFSRMFHVIGELEEDIVRFEYHMGHLQAQHPYLNDQGIR